MGRPKGSKNKPKNNPAITADIIAPSDITAQLEAKRAECDTLEQEIASITEEIASLTENIETLKTTLKAKRNALKEKRTALCAVEKELSTLEVQKAEADAKAAELAQRAQIEEMIKVLTEKGVGLETIMNKLSEVNGEVNGRDDVPAEDEDAGCEE